MRFPEGLSAAAFLERYWQKEPLKLSAGLDLTDPLLPAEELAWLATLEDVESRLVFTEHAQNSTSYRVEHGPFDERQLADLPNRDWTLLVQDVEKHLPEFRRWLSHVAFIPDWRVDDLMISFAAPGGSVGPHSDNYDVFLCQTSGQREWRLAAADQDLRPRQSQQLALLQDFDDPAPIVASPGDVLYLPPNLPHWGIADDACMTYSIGMRAPTRDELRCSFERVLPNLENPFENTSRGPVIFYLDADLENTESAAGRISRQAVDRCRRLAAPTVEVDDKSIAIALGCTVSDLKAWLSPDTPGADEISDLICVAAEPRPLQVHGMSRIAWWCNDGSAVIFANGWHREVSKAQLENFKLLCDSRLFAAVDTAPSIMDDLLPWLAKAGVFDALEATTSLQ